MVLCVCVVVWFEFVIVLVGMVLLWLFVCVLFVFEGVFGYLVVIVVLGCEEVCDGVYWCMLWFLWGNGIVSLMLVFDYVCCLFVFDDFCDLMMVIVCCWWLLDFDVDFEVIVEVLGVDLDLCVVVGKVFG